MSQFAATRSRTDFKQNSGIAQGFNSGFIVTRRAPRARPSQRKGRLGNRVAVIRQVVREVAGWAPYEKRMQELLKGGGNNPIKRCVRFARKRLGSHQRAKKKVGEMQDVIALIAKAEAQAKKK